MTDIQQACSILRDVLTYCEASCGSMDDEEFYPELHAAYESLKSHEVQKTNPA